MCVLCVWPESGSSLCRSLESWVRIVSLCVASSIPASLSSPSVTYSKPCRVTTVRASRGLHRIEVRISTQKKEKCTSQQAQTDAFWAFTYLQTIIFILQRLAVLGQTNLSQPPGDRTIIHVWTNWGERKLLTHESKCWHTYACTCLWTKKVPKKDKWRIIVASSYFQKAFYQTHEE